MSGIAGIYSKSGNRAPKGLLLAMAGELLHRGPDGTTLYSHERFGMVSTRFAAGGDCDPQPLTIPGERYWIMYDGEIFNHEELRSELQTLGHRFGSDSDTELLLHAFQEWGTSFLDRLNGPFALALWDEVKGELLLARDRFGVRPLYLADYAGDFCFASEARALLRHPQSLRELDASALVDTFTMWSTLPHKSSFTGIRELPAGHWLRLGPDGPPDQRQWWDLEFTGAAAWDGDNPAQDSTPHVTGRQVEALAGELRELLADSVRLRMQGSGPIGAFISGGLDSSGISALMQAQGGSRTGFSLGFSDARFDETAQQDQLAAALNLELQRIVISDADIAAAFPRVIELAERPLLRTAPAPVLLLSQLARNAGYRTVLTGEGADELLGGYNIFKETMVRRFWARQPDSQLRPLLLQRLYPYIAGNLSRSGNLLNSYFGAGLTETGDPLYSHRNRFRNGQRNLRFLNPAIQHDIATLQQLTESLPAGFTGLGPLSKAQYLEIHTFLQGNLLHSQGDRMLAASGVQGRMPFLDHRIAEFAAQLPEGLRLRGLQEKYLLRRALAPLLPQQVHERQKRPFRAPLLRPFLAAGAPAYASELLQPEALQRSGLFDVDLVGRLVAKCRRQLEQGNSENDEMALTGVLSAQLLYQQFVAEPRLAAPAIPAREINRSSASSLPAEAGSA